MWKNLWEPRILIKFAKYDKFEKVERDIDVENIFRYTNISENEVKKNISDLLNEKDQAFLEEVLKKHPIKYWVDEFMSYLKVAVYDNHYIENKNISNFDVKWIHNNLKIESPKIKFKK